MFRDIVKRSLPLFTAFLLPVLVRAHTGVGGGGFLAGLGHPVLGPDHLLAMLSVGIVSAQIGGKAIWTVPATFVGVMLLGGIMGMMNLYYPGVEFGISFSVLALGVAIAAGKKMRSWATMIFVAFFALFHGHAHGTEMPVIAKPVLYALGFILSTAGIHILGVVIGLFFTKTKTGATWLRYVGAGIAGVGFALITGI